MNSVLLAWIGHTDLKAANGHLEAGLGPIAQALKERKIPRAFLLCDHSTKDRSSFENWLRLQVDTDVYVQPVSLSGPTQFGEIHQHAVHAVQMALRRTSPQGNLIFHISPGTPAMAAVWIILAKTRFPAELIESSQKAGVRTVSVPFELSAEFIPDLLRKPDEELVRLSQGLPPDAPEFDSIFYRSDIMKRLVLKARRVAPRAVPVLIGGESGTGKELLARAIHRSSPRKEKTFVAVNCGAIPAELVDSEFFGHEKGSFTGAVARRIGHLEAASGGTLFLDEIGDLPLPAQVKLLRALQEREVMPIGSSKSRPVDLRVIAATHRNLLDEVDAGRFREDLFHRLGVAILHVPPLRERGNDLGLLIDKLLEQINADAIGQPGFEQKNLSAGARNLLLRHDWPGNVRELLNTLQRAAIWSSGRTIDTKDAQEALLPRRKTSMAFPERPFEHGFNIRALVNDLVRHYLEKALSESGGNKTIAARLLGLPSYQTLTNWLQKHGLEK